MNDIIMAILPEYASFSAIKSMADSVNFDSSIEEGTLAILNMHGPIFHKSNMISSILGIPTTESLKNKIQGFVSNPEVSAIVINIDSPGGSVAGLKEFADSVHAAGKIKPVISLADSSAASAAYFIGSASTEFYSIYSGEVGSIGVISMHVDESGYMEKEGFKVEIIKAGKYKGEMNPYGPLTDEAKEYLQGKIDSYYRDFIDSVALYRGVNSEKVESDFGQGRMLRAKEATEIGMIDGIMTMEGVINMLSNRMKKKGKSKGYMKAQLRLQELA